jgi:hypothetical protein
MEQAAASRYTSEKSGLVGKKWLERWFPVQGWVSARFSKTSKLDLPDMYKRLTSLR